MGKREKEKKLDSKIYLGEGGGGRIRGIFSVLWQFAVRWEEGEELARVGGVCGAQFIVVLFLAAYSFVYSAYFVITMRGCLNLSQIHHLDCAFLGHSGCF